MDHGQLRQDIAGIVAEITEIPVDTVTPDARLVEDLGADSMNALELLAALERRFNIVIDPSRMVELETPATILALVESLVQEQV
jgi:acyl carrier protein